MSEFSPSFGTVERRFFRNVNSTWNRLPAAPNTLPAFRSGNPDKDNAKRVDLIEILEGQIDLSMRGHYPLCLAVFELTTKAHAQRLEMVVRAIAKLFRMNLKPTDIVIRYKKTTLALILHELDEEAARDTCFRLSKLLVRAVRIGREEFRVVPTFGLGLSDGAGPNRAGKLLAVVEGALMREFH